MRRTTRLAAGVAGLVVVGVIGALPAFGHVTANAPGATQGGYTTVTFKVPTESDTASTTALKVQLPTDNPIASVSIQPKVGWTYTVKKAKPSTPLSNDDGPVTEIVTEVDWKVAAGNTGIKPDEFDTFAVSAGPLPTKVNTLTFKAVQTYSDGKVVSWIETPAPGSTAEPEHPAPTIRLAAATSPNADPSAASPSPTAAPPSTTAAAPSPAAAAAKTDSGTSGLSVAGFTVGILGLLLALGASFWILTVGNKLRRGSSTS